MSAGRWEEGQRGAHKGSVGKMRQEIGAATVWGATYKHFQVTVQAVADDEVVCHADAVGLREREGRGGRARGHTGQTRHTFRSGGIWRARPLHRRATRTFIGCPAP